MQHRMVISFYFIFALRWKNPFISLCENTLSLINFLYSVTKVIKDCLCSKRTHTHRHRHTQRDTHTANTQNARWLWYIFIITSSLTCCTLLCSSSSSMLFTTSPTWCRLWGQELSVALLFITLTLHTSLISLLVLIDREFSILHVII